ncbi:hypothetical protein AAK899_09815 [Erysipelotrichaceae bacterium 51-3]
MSKSENDLLDSLLDSLSDDQEMEKKIGEFARNKERMQRIERARQTSEQFQQTYSRQGQNSRQANTNSSNVSPKPQSQEADIPDFLNSHQNTPNTSNNPNTAGSLDLHRQPDEFGQTRVQSPLADDFGQTRVMNGQNFDQTRHQPSGMAEDSFDHTRVMNSPYGSARAGDQNLDQTRTARPFGQKGLSSDMGTTRPIQDFSSMGPNPNPNLEATRTYQAGGMNPNMAQTQTFNPRQPVGNPVPPYTQHTATHQPYDVPDLTGRINVGGYGQEDLEQTRRMPNPGDAGSTRVFNSAQASTNAGAGDGTVRMNKDEIRKFSEQDEPLLHREYLKSDEDEDDFDESLLRKEPAYRKEPSYSRSRSHKKRRSPWKTYAIICGVVLAIVLVGTGGVMTKRFIDSQASSVQNNEQFQKLFDWISNYGSYDDSERKKILDFRSVYEKLGDENKQKINDTLMALTGKTFDELLVAADDKDKPDASNENVANAERKAKLKDEMASLQAEIDTLTGRLNQATERIAQAENEYNQKKADYDNAVAAAQTAQSNVDLYTGQLANLPNDQELQDQILSLQNQLEELINSSNDHHDSSQTSDSSIVDNRDQLRAQISELQAQQRNNAQTRSDLEDNLASAQQTLNDANNSLSSLKQAADTAYGAWQAIKNDADPIQAEIVSKTNEMNSLQSEYDSIQ